MTVSGPHTPSGFTSYILSLFLSSRCGHPKWNLIRLLVLYFFFLINELQIAVSVFCLFSFVAVVVFFFTNTLGYTSKQHQSRTQSLLAFWSAGYWQNKKQEDSGYEIETALEFYAWDWITRSSQQQYSQTLTNRLFYSPKDITLTPLVAAYENHSCKRPAPITDTVFMCRGCPLLCPLTRASTTQTWELNFLEWKTLPYAYISALFYKYHHNWQSNCLTK